MQNTNFRVVLTGKIIDGFDRDHVIQSVIKLFKCSEEKAVKYLSDKPTPLKKQMDQSTAERYRDRLMQAGLSCTIESPNTDDLETNKTTAITSIQGSTSVMDTLDAGLSLEPAPGDTPENNSSAGNTESNQHTQQSDQFICPKCQMPQDKSDECIQCGIIFSKYQPVESTAVDSPDDIEDELDDWNEIELFVGENFEEYRHKLRDLDNNDGKYKLQWHWAAFLIPIPWMIFRKMYIWAFVYFIMLSVAPMLALIPLILLPGFVGNYLYYRHIKQQINKVTSVGDQRRIDIGHAGNTNSILITIVISLIAAIIMSFVMYKLVFESYVDEALQQLNSDVEFLSDGEDQFEQATKIQMLVIKNAVTMQRKMLMDQNTHFTMPTDMDEVLATLGGQKDMANDAWGTAMEFEVSGKTMILYSAGGDTVFDTEDDIILESEF